MYAILSGKACKKIKVNLVTLEAPANYVSERSHECPRIL